jgi:hypothetical protein
VDKKIFVDVLGHVAVVGSLIFVGVQVHQAAAASRSATVLQLKDNWVQLNLAGATSPVLIDAYDTVIARGWESDARARGLVDAFDDEFRKLMDDTLGTRAG